MREFNTPQRETPRATAPVAIGSSKSKEPRTKKPLKIKKKRLSGDFSAVEENSLKESIDFSSISEVVDSHQETKISKICLMGFQHRGSPISDKCSSSNLPFSSKINSDNCEVLLEDRSLKQIDKGKLASLEPEALGHLLTTAQSQILKSLHLNSEFNKLPDALVQIEMGLHEVKCRLKDPSLKIHFVFSCLLIWIVVKLIIFCFGSGPQKSFIGPLPT